MFIKVVYNWYKVRYYDLIFFKENIFFFLKKKENEKEKEKFEL